MNKNKNLHQILKQIRIDKNISIKSYAYNLGYNLSTVYAIESGKRTISVLLYLKLCEALGIDPLTILKKQKATKQLGS